MTGRLEFNPAHAWYRERAPRRTGDHQSPIGESAAIYLSESVSHRRGVAATASHLRVVAGRRVVRSSGRAITVNDVSRLEALGEFRGSPRKLVIVRCFDSQGGRASAAASAASRGLSSAGHVSSRETLSSPSGVFSSRSLRSENKRERFARGTRLETWFVAKTQQTAVGLCVSNRLEHDDGGEVQCRRQRDPEPAEKW